MIDSSTTFHGIVHGKTIELLSDLGVPDGARIAIQLQSVEAPAGAATPNRAGSAGAWAEFPEMDKIMAAIESSRSTDGRPGVSF